MKKFLKRFDLIDLGIILAFFSLLGIVLLITSCANSPAAPQTSDAPTTTTTIPTPAKLLQAKISWEKYPENTPWSDFVAGLVSETHFDVLDQAQDITTFCPMYKILNRDQKVTVWVEFISSLAKPESGWNASSRYVEKELAGVKNPVDPVTGQAVVSEGLLQLSYQDKKNMTSAKDCRFDWAKDKNLKPTDPNKTILDPYINLECGLKILAGQIKSKGKIVLSSGVYWAVIKEGGKYQSIASIAKSVASLPFCN